MYQFIGPATLLFADDEPFNFAPIGVDRIFILPTGEAYQITKLLYGMVKPSAAAKSATLIGQASAPKRKKKSSNGDA